MLLLVFFSIQVFGQLNSEKSGRIIEFEFNARAYKKAATDSVQKIYNMQQMYEKDLVTGISNKYKFSDLSLKSIPAFRIKPEANAEFSCDTPIEDYILFDDTVTYQVIYVSNKGKHLTSLIIPDRNVEMEKILGLEPGSISSKHQYSFYVIQGFQETSLSLSDRVVLNDSSENFFFCIYAINNLFEIEKDTGLIYAYVDYYEKGKEVLLRMPINTYVQDYLGPEVIKALSRHYYDDFEGTGELEGKECVEKPYIKPRIVKYKIRE